MNLVLQTYWNSTATLKIMSIEKIDELAANFKSKHVPFVEVSLIVEYIMCLSGTSASVERLFSAINKIWSTYRKNPTTNKNTKIDAYCKI